jgi:predicted lipoprotein with Yx(FWY)xxD motif
VFGHSRSLTLLGLAATPLVALAVAGCGGVGSSNTVATPSLQIVPTGVGNVLVDAKNRTVYLFRKDTGTRSNCYGACARNWPPVRANGKPTVGDGVKASLVGTTARSDGKPQVTYNGHPLYLFTGDNIPATTNGQGVNAFGARWFVVAPAGSAVTRRSTEGRSNGY